MIKSDLNGIEIEQFSDGLKNSTGLNQTLMGLKFT